MFYDGGRSDIIGDSYDILYSFFHSNSKFNSLKYHEPLIDNWLDEAIKESNPIKRNALYKRIVTKILDDTPAIFLYHHIPNFAYNSHKIIKLITDPYGVIDFTKIELN